ncbi:hypothetical protein CFAM422_000173 [Trichoderma lentiforme]|uniref:Uncharacterized protein n=1 Tax=Trichoderma lentiforme TaxID=1567552 RepID=A0A9P5CH23_9HYPO|nr:hypothetical protein CFAM422_000173 [Trichoderma lentiforme]
MLNSNFDSQVTLGESRHYYSVWDIGAVCYLRLHKDQLSHHAVLGVGKIKIRIAERPQYWDNGRYDMSGL